MWTGLNCLRTEYSCDLFWTHIEPAGATKGWELFDQLGYCGLFKKGSAGLSQLRDITQWSSVLTRIVIILSLPDHKTVFGVIITFPWIWYTFWFPSSYKLEGASAFSCSENWRNQRHNAELFAVMSTSHLTNSVAHILDRLQLIRLKLKWLFSGRGTSFCIHLFLRNVCRLSTNYTALCARRQNSSKLTYSEGTAEVWLLTKVTNKRGPPYFVFSRATGQSWSPQLKYRGWENVQSAQGNH
jgi:hypothetical protein